MVCEDQALTSTEVCVKWECDKARLELSNGGKYWCCPVCGSCYGLEAKIGMLSYYYVNRFGIEVDVRVASDNSGQYEMIDLIVDGGSVRGNDAIGNDRQLVGDLVEEIIDKDEEIITLKEKNRELQEQYDSMFRTMVKASEKLGDIEDSKLRARRKKGML